MSIYPTLCELAGITTPPAVEGLDIRPLLADPASAWPHVAITTFGRNNHAIRSDRWRLIRYADGSEELYDHSNDSYEWTNLAARPEHAAVKAELAQHLPGTNQPAVGDDKPGSAKPRIKQRLKQKR
jgi:arylsulfatase A-like enzyme